MVLGWVPQLQAQEFGGNATNTKWQQINTDTVRVIFPKGTDSVAENISRYVNQIAATNAFGLGNKLRKVNIVLQNDMVVSNGYVGLGPFRSEFYLTPSADNFELGTLSWPKQLAVHEYRHVQQFNNFDRGVSGIVRKLLGGEAYSLAINTALPNWFFEGDAVYYETALTNQGRGRLPAFLKSYPALWASGKKYSWMKLRNQSLKDYVPNHYDLGYLLVNYGYKKYGSNFWDKVSRDASTFRSGFYPMQSAIKKYSGNRFKAFRDSAFSYYKMLYDISVHVSDSLHYQNNVFAVNKKNLTQYYYPVQLDSDKMLYQKQSSNKCPAFFVRDENGEHFIRYRDISVDEQFSYRNGKIAYAAFETHPRWSRVNYSVIKVLDLETKKQTTLKHRTKLFSPDISSDGKWIVANQFYKDGHSGLAIFSLSNSKLVKEFSRKDIGYFSNPKWGDSLTVFAVLRYEDAKTSIAKIDINSGRIENLTPPSLATIGQINLEGKSIYFTGSQKLKDEIFKLDMASGQLFKLTTPGVGSYFVNSGFGKISWSMFTSEGYQLQQITKNKAQWQEIPMTDFIQSKTGLIAVEANEIEVENKSSVTPRLEKKYSALTRPINFHSWQPNYTDPLYSVTFYGNNVLNTVQTEVYYLYNQNNYTHTTGGRITYAGLFPFISLGTDYTFNKQTIILNKVRKWNQLDNYVGLSVPLKWVRGRTNKSLNVYTNFYNRTDINVGATKKNFNQLNYGYLSHGFSWYQRVQLMPKHIYPRLGYSASIGFRHTISAYKSWQENAAINLFLPGIGSSHSLVLSAAGQYSGSKDHVFSNNVNFARGYVAADYSKVTTTTANYHLPLFYPDWGFANLFYLQRVRSNLFFDHTWASNKTVKKNQNINSTGAEIYFDTKWWNQYSLSMGFRLAHTLTTIPGKNKGLYFEFILPTNLFPK